MWTHKNDIVYDEKGVAFADCRYQKGRAEQIVREHNAVPGLVHLAKTFRRIANDGEHPGMVKLIDKALAQAKGMDGE